MGSRNRISLNVVVYNEEARLEECLTDARDHVDEIVVVDQMSTDGTAAIAQRLADVYVRDIHHGHAEPSRELAASRSSGDWILILDADERMSDLLKDKLRDLVAREVDGYWLTKVNRVDGVEVNTIEHFRLVRTSRTRFDPQPHGTAVSLTGNVDRFEETGIVHEKSAQEQIYDDARYERIAMEEVAPTSAKRQWLSHNRALRADRVSARRMDLERLLPPSAAQVLVVGDVHVAPPGCALTHVSPADLGATEPGHAGEFPPASGPSFDAVILAGDEDLLASVSQAASRIRPGGVVIGTAPVLRNRRGLEEMVGALLSGSAPETPIIGFTRRQLLDGLAAAGLDVRWLRLVRDGWLDALRLQPDGSGTVVESKDFLLRRVPAEVAEELTAQEIVFAAQPRPPAASACSIVVVDREGGSPDRFAAALAATAPEVDYEIVGVGEERSLAAGWNAGARASAGRLLVFATTEAMPEPGWLERLMAVHSGWPDPGAVGSKVVAREGTIEHAGLVLGNDLVPYRIYQGESGSVPHVNRFRIMPAVAGEGMITSRARFVEVGGFDEDLADDLAEADYCLRLRTRGLPIVYSPGAVLRSRLRAMPGTASDFRRTAKQFAARWSRTAAGSEGLVCRVDQTADYGERSRSWRLPRAAARATGGLPAIAWTSHFLEDGGYTEEALAAVEALDDAGLHVVANPVTWEPRKTPLTEVRAQRLQALMERELPEEFVHVAHVGADRFKRHPDAIWNVGRTMFETDSLPAVWLERCKMMDEIWVPCEHNLTTFANAGVDPAKLHKVPETLDLAVFDPGVAPLPVDGAEGFVFLSVFSWIHRKAWDVLIRAWYEEFEADDDVTLVLKTDTALAPAGTDCRRQIESFVREQLKRDPATGARVVVLDQPLELTDVPRLYRAADAFVLASHGEGWGRPHMEAMAMGLPTIATRWGGNLEFMNDDNSCLVDCELVPAPQDEWRRGHRWARPLISDLRRIMRWSYEHPEKAQALGRRASADVRVSCRPEQLVEAVRERLEAIASRRRGRSGPNGHRPDAGGRTATTTPVRPSRRRLSACVTTDGESGLLSECLDSLQGVADEVIVVDAAATEDMASVRNEALNGASGDWVLMLDATTTLDPGSAELVRHLVADDRFVGYGVRERRQVGFDGAVSPVERRVAALFPRHPNLRYVGRVGEQLLSRRPDLPFRLARSQVVVNRHERHGADLDPVAVARRRLPLLERSVREAPDEPFHFYNLGAALHVLGLQSDAEDSLRRALALAPRATWAPAAQVSLADTLAARGQMREAVKLGRAAAESAPEWPQVWCALGDTLSGAGRDKAALRAYQRALECGGEPWLAGEESGDTAWRVRVGIARIHLRRDDPAAAADCLARAVTLNLPDGEVRALLARALDGLGRHAEAGHHVKQAARGPGAGPGAFAALGDLFARKAEDALLRGLVEHPESRLLLERMQRLRAARTP